MVKYRISAGIASALVAAGLACGAAFAASPALATETAADEAAAEQPAEEADAIEEAGTLEAQTIGLEGVSNARQLGGYTTEDGRTVKDGVLLRTGALSGATEADIDRLVNEYNLGYVVDFRTSSEIASALDPEIDGVENIWCSVLEESSDDEASDESASENDEAASTDGESADAGTDDSSADDSSTDDTGAALAGAAATAGGEDMLAMLVGYAESADLSDMYVTMVGNEHYQQGYRAFFDVLLNNEDGKAVLWHCTGGKDRAGFAAVLVLSALGVDRETALDDFALTNEFVADRIDRMTAAAEEAGYDEDQVEAVATLTGVNRDYMAKALDFIDEEYGSMDEYLHNQIGLTDEEIAQLQEMYLEG